MKLTDAQLKQIYAHAEETYPYECCGFLVGYFAEGGVVKYVKRATNQNREREDRFVMSGEEYSQTQFEVDEAGLDIIGIYHSHPDWPSVPSQTDMESAWEDVFYLIVSVHDGHPLNTAIWQLADTAPRRFEQLPLEIVDEAVMNDFCQSLQPS